VLCYTQPCARAEHRILLWTLTSTSYKEFRRPTTPHHTHSPAHLHVNQTFHQHSTMQSSMMRMRSASMRAVRRSMVPARRYTTTTQQQGSSSSTSTQAAAATSEASTSVSLGKMQLDSYCFFHVLMY
jgi:hypothetical protein